MLLQDQFAKLMNEYPKVEKLIDEVTRIRAEMAIIKSNFNRLDVEEMEDSLEKYDRLYNKIPEITQKIDLYQSKIYALADKLDMDDFDGYDGKTHKLMIKAMRKQIKETYDNQIEVDIEYEEGDGEISANEIDEIEDKKGILNQFKVLKRKIKG